MNRKNNIKSPRKFQQKLDEVMDGIYDLMELSKEHDLPAVSEDGVRCFDEEDGKTGFQVAGQFERPSEYLQTLLDIMRVQYEPNPLGTFFLNSNIGFILEQIPESSFQLGYISLTSKTDKSFSQFWDEDVMTYLDMCGYDINKASAAYAVVSTGWQRYGYELSSEVSEKLDSGFSVEEGITLISSVVNDDIEAPQKHIYAGFCPDEALGSQLRLSLWLFTNNKILSIQ